MVALLVVVSDQLGQGATQTTYVPDLRSIMGCSSFGSLVLFVFVRQAAVSAIENLSQIASIQRRIDILQMLISLFGRS